jgi:hypothetical protein
LDDASPETITAALPEFDTVTFSEALLPTATLPRFRLDGLAAITPAPLPEPEPELEPELPVPLTATAVGALLALLKRVTAPLAAPDDFGENPTVMETL